MAGNVAPGDVAPGGSVRDGTAAGSIAGHSYGRLKLRGQNGQKILVSLVSYMYCSSTNSLYLQ